MESQDGLQYLAVARQIYYTQTFEMPAAKYPNDNIHMNVQVGRDGKEFSPTGLGYSLAYLPAVAAEDIFNRLADVSPTKNFPLDNDWPIMLFGSMTNAFFGAVFITTFYLFLKTFNFSDRTAIFLAILLFLSSNLLVYTKHGFAHMMFICFMWLSFYFIRLYRLEQKIRYVVFAALSYGVVVISYNPTFFLPLPALGIYYLFSVNWTQRNQWKPKLQQITRDILVGLVSISPFLALYSWFNWIRFGGATSTGYGTGGFVSLPVPQPFVLYEGLWGLLFSPGKSIWLFTPILLLLLIFWFKFKKQYLAEIVAGIVISAVYIVFTASLVGGSDYYPWHGEASFGPRYILPILPFGILLASFLFQELTKKQRYAVFLPIVCFGLAIQVVGVLIPYQVRFSGLQYEFHLNGHRITYDVYANFLPRFSPLYSMSKWFVKKTLQVPAFYLRPASVQYIDGVHGVFRTGDGDWRQIEQVSAVKIARESTDQPLSLEVINLVSTTSATHRLYDLEVIATHNESEVGKVTVATSSTEVLTATLPKSESDQLVVLRYAYVGTPSALIPDQYPFVKNLQIGSTQAHAESYNYPYVSRVSQNVFNTEYNFWGSENTKLWDLWNMRSINYVHTLDLWWLRPLHYWDLPKNFYLLLFLGNVSICVTSSYVLYKAVVRGEQKPIKK